MNKDKLNSMRIDLEQLNKEYQIIGKRIDNIKKNN